MPKSIAIIGAGIAGLSAGCYARMNGFETHLFELHDKPGGLCTAWQRQGYTFDGCIHWLVGTARGSSFRRIWDELGALQDRPTVEYDQFLRYEGTGGKALILHTNVDRLERHLLELAPEDAGAIHELTGAIRKLTRMEMPVENPGLLGGLRLAARFLPLLPTLRRFGRITPGDFAQRLRNPFLREAFGNLWSELPEFPLLVMLLPLALMHQRDAGYPIGGSLAFARAIERRYLDLGGQVHYRSRVTKILVEEGRAVGVRLADGTEHRADYVISAADGHATLYEMLEGKYLGERLRAYYEGGLQPFPPMIQVSLGVARDLSAEPNMAIFPLRRPVTIAGQTHARIGYKHFCHDRTLAPAGKSVVAVTFMTDYEYWRALHADRQRYEGEKRSIAEAVTGALEERFPGLAAQVEVVDVATPMTYERYTANWRASFEGWLLTTRTMGLVAKGLPKSLPGLANFHMIGQWTSPGGGLPPAAKDGRDVVWRICRREKRPFVTTVPAPLG